MENFNLFRIDSPQMKNILGGGKISRKESGTMRYPDGKLVAGWYISQYDTETRTYKYYNLAGQEIYCPY